MSTLTSKILTVASVPRNPNAGCSHSVHGTCIISVPKGLSKRLTTTSHIRMATVKKFKEKRRKEQVLARMENWNLLHCWEAWKVVQPHGDRMAVLQKVKPTVTAQLSNSTSWYTPEGTESRPTQTSAHLCSRRHASQQSKGGSNSSAHRQGLKKQTWSAGTVGTTPPTERTF